MQHADVFDLSRDRRVSASLEVLPRMVELLVLNGGSRAEEVRVVVRVRARVRSAMYCIDGGTNVRLTFPLLHGERSSMVRIDVTGGPAPIVLSGPSQTWNSVRASAGPFAVAAVFLAAILTGSRFAPLERRIAVQDIAVPTSVPIRVQPVAPRAQAVFVALAPPISMPGMQMPIVPTQVVSHTIARHHARLAMHQPHLTGAKPSMTLLNVPAIVRSGELVRIAYRAIAQRVRIVASIGPTVVARRMFNAQNGVVAIRPPKSSRNGRVMTVRAYALNGTRVASLEATVVLVHPPE